MSLVDTAGVDPIRYDFVLPLIEASLRLPGGGRIVAIDGPSGAGKTTLADQLAHRLGAGVLTVDGLCPGWAGLNAVPDLLAAVVEPLARGEAGHYRRYDWEHGGPGELVTVQPRDLLIVDGVGSGSRPCRPWLSLLIWIDDDSERRKVRALERDGEVFAREWDRWAAQEATLFSAERTRESADAVLSGDEG